MKKVNKSEGQLVRNTPDALMKHDQIIEAAIRRFSHFGIHKTKLAEIADDLSISKPSLFYYFQDKNRLIAAVAEKIINETVTEIETALSASASVKEGLHNLIAIKRKYFKKYYLLAMQSEGMQAATADPLISDVFSTARERVEKALINLLEKDLQENAFMESDLKKTSTILLDTMSAFEQGMQCRNGIPDLQDIDRMFDKQAEIIDLALTGLKHHDLKSGLQVTSSDGQSSGAELNQ